MRKIPVLLGLLLLACLSKAQTSENLVVITLDGTRWQEVFGGADPKLINAIKPPISKKETKANFKSDDPKLARKKLMPWVWSTLVSEGQIYGNRLVQNKVNCSNRFRISYPGYSEILTGYSDPSISTNAKKYNDNITILEWFNNLPEFNEKVAAFTSWDVFPYIINDQRSGVHVNAGFRKAEDDYLTSTELLLNHLLEEIPSPWTSVRADAFTHQYVMQYLKKNHPRLLFISYGEMDDYAHAGKYDLYLKSIHQTDRRIGEIWDYLQSDSVYAGKTTIIITTDHGRGGGKSSDWEKHGILYRGSDETWIAVLGPQIEARGEIKEEMQIVQNQIAKTLAKILGYEYTSDQEEVGDVIKSIFDKTYE